MNYSTYVTTMQTMLVIQDATGQANLAAIMPNMIEYAELRCYRDLQLLNTVGSGTGTLTSGSRSFTIPVTSSPVAGASFVVVQSVNVYSPAGSTVSNGTVNPCERVSKEFLLQVCPDPSATDVPEVFANVDNATLLFGPTPDAAYLAQVYGTFRPVPLSISNSTTILTSLFPDLFLQASLVFGYEYQRDFSAIGNDPQAGAGAEMEYQKLLKGAGTEEALKQAQSQGWTPYPTSPSAIPPRQ